MLGPVGVVAGLVVLVVVGVEPSSRQSSSWLILTPDCTVASDVLLRNWTLTEPAMPTSPASALAAADELITPSLSPSVPSMYLVREPRPSVWNESTNSPIVVGKNSSGDVRYGYSTSAITRVARSASSSAPDSSVAVAVLLMTPTSTATLIATLAPCPSSGGLTSLSALIWRASSIRPTTSMSSLDFSRAAPPTSATAL